MKRKLTKSEIDSIINSLNFFENNPEPLEVCLEKHRESLRKQLLKVEISPGAIEKLKEKIITSFYQSIIQPGEAVGVNAAQCIGEPITQSTLDTFHHTGDNEMNVTLGFGRSKELMNCTSNQSTPSVNIFFKRSFKKLSELHPIIDSFPETLINDLIDSIEIFSPEELMLTWWHKYFIREKNIKPAKLDWILRLNFNVESLFNRNITNRDIAEILENKYADIRIIVSPLNIAILDVLVDCSSITIEGIKSPELQILANNSGGSDDDVYRYYMTKIVSPEIKKIKVTGIKDIKIIYPYFYGEKILAVKTQGTNLREILNHPEIDTFNTISNDIWEIFYILDIEAAREFLLQEFTKIVSMGGNYINSRHIEILVDKMCQTGTMRPITRHGTEPEQSSVISKASFETVMINFINGAIKSESDPINTISPNIAVGKAIRAGTGFSSVKRVNIVTGKNIENVALAKTENKVTDVNEEM